MFFYCLYWTGFSKNTTTSLWSSFFKSRPDLCGERTLFGFFRGLVSISVSCFYSGLGNANVCAEVEGTPINSMLDLVCFRKLFQPVSFGRRHLFLVLSKQFPHYPPLTLFHIFDAHFLQKHLLDPMAFCWAVMAKSFLKVAQIFGRQNFSPASFWRNYLKTKFFRRASVIYCCNYLAYYPLLGFPLSISGCIMHG